MKGEGNHPQLEGDGHITPVEGRERPSSSREGGGAHTAVGGDGRQSSARGYTGDLFLPEMAVTYRRLRGLDQTSSGPAKRTQKEGWSSTRPPAFRQQR